MHRECKWAHNSYVKDIIDNESYLKKLYSYINGKRCDSSGVALLKKDGIAYSDPKVNASVMNDKFCSVFTEEDMSRVPVKTSNPFPEMSTFYIDTKGVTKHLKKKTSIRTRPRVLTPSLQSSLSMLRKLQRR